MTVNFVRPRAEAVLSEARSIYVSACAAEIPDAPEILSRCLPRNAVVTGIFSPLLNKKSYANSEIDLRVRSFFLTGEMKRDLARGLIDYCPWRYVMIDRWLAEPGRFDTAVVMMAPPDKNGMCSLGVQVDFLPRFHRQVERVVGFINPNMPRTSGDLSIAYESLAAAVDYDVPLKTMAQKDPDPAAVKIARTIAGLVPDGATVQFGIGQIPSQVIAQLADHRSLRVHSGIVDDNILSLEASGALDADRPIVTGTAMGTGDLYRTLSDNDRFSFRSVAYTHDYRTIRDLKSFVAINSVLQADLFGQVSAETSGGTLVASPGGLPDFIRGALGNQDGRSIIAVRAQGLGTHPRGIVPVLDPPNLVTNPAADADIIVTEFGAAHIRNLSMDERASAIISIADPQDQANLEAEWRQMRSRIFART
jgi:acyl-CoA hydrolase